MADNANILRPIPQHAFQFTPASTTPSSPSSPNPELIDDSSKHNSPSRTRSILNLTSSTLFGIYAPEDASLNTPWGPGAQTPLTDTYRSPSDSIHGRSPGFAPSSFSPPEVQKAPSEPQLEHRAPRRPVGATTSVPLHLRAVLLFGFGVAYGVIVSQLHDNPGLAPVRLEGIDRSSWRYFAYWGLAGVVWGTLLPWVDVLWEQGEGEGETKIAEHGRGPGSDRGKEAAERGAGSGADWTPVVRSGGAFIGIAFAIRKLPWQSTLQVSLTLALVNPVLWYLMDCTPAGFLLSATVGIFGTFILLGINPNMVPSPAMSSSQMLNASSAGVNAFGRISHESIGMWTWLASVLFCSCVCFGNLGRRLALDRTENRKSTL